MVVYKYRSVAEMPRPATAAAEGLAKRIRAVWSRAFRISPPSPPRGVMRFSSIEAANEAHEQAREELIAATAEISHKRVWGK